MQLEAARTITDEIMHLYQAHGGAEYAGEKVSQLEHMAQAAQLAEEEGHDEEVILAAFLHDIGHLSGVAGSSDTPIPDAKKMDGFGIMDHEAIGAEYLRDRGFSKKLARLVESHVEAKRYLTAKDPAYYAALSEASKRTLEYQGGPMTAAEADAFEQYPLFDLIIKMRRWDEQAKIEHKPLPDLEHFREMILRHLTSSNNNKA